MHVFRHEVKKLLIFLPVMFCFAMKFCNKAGPVKKYTCMKSNKKFETLCSRLLEMDALSLSSVDFRKLCRECGADEREMDNMMYASYGMSGDEVMAGLIDGTFSSWVVK